MIQQACAVSRASVFVMIVIVVLFVLSNNKTYTHSVTKKARYHSSFLLRKQRVVRIRISNATKNKTSIHPSSLRTTPPFFMIIKRMYWSYIQSNIKHIQWLPCLDKYYQHFFSLFEFNWFQKVSLFFQIETKIFVCVCVCSLSFYHRFFTWRIESSDFLWLDWYRFHMK